MPLVNKNHSYSRFTTQLYDVMCYNLTCSSDLLEIVGLAVGNAIADETGATFVKRCMARGAAQARWMKFVVWMHSHDKSVHDRFLASMAYLRWKRTDFYHKSSLNLASKMIK